MAIIFALSSLCYARCHSQTYYKFKSDPLLQLLLRPHALLAQPSNLSPVVKEVEPGIAMFNEKDFSIRFHCIVGVD